MFKHGKISLTILTLLVLLSNIGFSFTFELCKMNMSSHCACGVEENTTERSGSVSIDGKSCCSEETRVISNQTEFEIIKNFKSDFSQTLAPIHKPSAVLEPVFENNQRKTILIFYAHPQDIPVFNSSLII